MSTTVLLVLAAGAGRRFGGCKQLAPVGPGGEALMDYTIDGARRAGFERVVVVTRPDLDGAMADHFARWGGSRLGGSRIELVHQPAGPADPAGTVPAVLAARRVVGDDQPFAVVNADDLYPLDAVRALREWVGPGHAVLGFHLAATLLPGPCSGAGSVTGSGCAGEDAGLSAGAGSGSGLGSGSDSVNRALCRCASDGRLLGLAEASITRHDGGFLARQRGATADTPVSADQLVSMNGWAFHPSIWSHFESASGGAGAPAGEVLLPVVVDRLIARGTATVTVLPVVGPCLGVTWPGELAIVRELVGRMVAAGELPARVSWRGSVMRP